MELIIFSGHYYYITDLIFEILLLIFILLVSISFLFLLFAFLKYLLKKIYIKFYPHKTAKIAPIPFADIANIDNNENRIDNIAVEVIIEDVEVIS